MYAMMKLSVLFFYRRIFLVQTSARLSNNLMIGLIISWSLAFFFAEVFECGTNPAAQWDPAAGPPKCVNITAMNFAYAITDVIGDILVVTIPYPCIRKLNMSTREKFGIALIFMLGTLSTVASIIRLYFISVAYTEDYGNMEKNVHAAGTPPAVWSTVEGAVGVLAACLPPLGPLIKRLPSPQSAFLSLRRRLTEALTYKHSRETSGHGESIEHVDLNGESDEESKKISSDEDQNGYV